jgi:hypothetical protein
MAQQRHPPGPPMTLGNMRDLAVRNLRAEAERKAIVDAQEIVAIWNAERVVSQLADREPPPVTEPPSAQERGGRYHLTTR